VVLHNEVVVAATIQAASIEAEVRAVVIILSSPHLLVILLA
jgi:hypothetical protein